MLIIKIWCLPNQTEKRLKKLHDSIVKAVTKIKELGLKSEKDLVNLFVPDLMKYGLGTEIIIEVELFTEKEISEETRNKLAEDVGKTVKELYPDTEKIFCFVKRPTLDGFWTPDKASMLYLHLYGQIITKK